MAAALVYALLGGLLGLAWFASPDLVPRLALRAHAHLMLVGFVGMMIFGIGLHVLPRFTGRPLYSERLADVHFALANFGLLAMAGGWLAWSQQGLVHAGIVLLAVGFALDVASLAVLGGLLGWGGLCVFASRLLPVLVHADRGTSSRSSPRTHVRSPPG